MNDFDVASRVASAGTLTVQGTRRMALPHTHPVRLSSLSTPDSGPALTRDFRTRLSWSDSAIVLAAALPAAAAGASVGSGTTSLSATIEQLALLSLVVAGWSAALWLFRTRESRVLCFGVTEYRRVVSASTMTFGVLGILLVVANIDAARFYFIIALPLGLSALVVDRWIWRKWLARRSEAGCSLSRVLVVGTRDDVEYVIEQVRRKLGLAYAVVGAIVENDNLDGRDFGTSAIPVSHDFDAVAAMASRLGADAVIVAGAPRDRANFVQELSWSLEGTATDLILATSLANVAGPRIHLRPVEGLPLIHVEIPQFEGGRHALKRGFDMAVAAAALLVLSPLLAIVALIIRLDSPGPVLFRQERVGRDGTLFTMLKFRSMVATAEQDLERLRERNEGSGALFKIRNDPRITRVGRFIRRHSIDELPQLWNILVGDMSVVGPRPPLPSEVTDYEDHVHRRLYIRPGLTGMWQINGRSTLDWEESVKLDLFYVENWSLVGDLVIMWRTIREVRRPIGAF
jgi:exopolysaccharide biosynthesis polyprenyl glycosylphosphotransferase